MLEINGGIALEMNRVLKKDGKLAVMTFVRIRFLGIKRIYEYLKRDHYLHIFDVDDLKLYLEIIYLNFN